jgi:putative iron-regulated protein
VKSYKFLACITALCLSLSTVTSTFAAPKSLNKKILFPEDVATKVINDYSQHVYNTYVELLSVNKDLQSAISTFTKNPTSETQTTAKNAWLAARKVYSQSEPFRFYGGTIDDAETGPEGMMNAWPLDEAYIDYIKEDPKAGIINNVALYPKITKEALTLLNEKDGEKNISTGYHAIEFLLWGQDFSLKSAGTRSFEDYIKSKNVNAERRATYINLLADLLVEHTQLLVNGWNPAVKGNYLEKFLKEPKKESMQKIFLGLGTLAMDEMSGERMTVPLEKNDQENEQNCFSDTTTLDLTANQVGILNIYTGNYQGFKGTGVKEFVRAVDPRGEAKLQSQLDKTLSMYNKIKMTFDNVIMENKKGPEKKLANQIIDSLQSQAKLMAKSIANVGIDINIEQ